MGLFDVTTEHWDQHISHTGQSVGRIDTLIAQFLQAHQVTVDAGTFDGTGAQAWSDLHREGTMRGRRMQAFLDAIGVGLNHAGNAYVDGNHQMVSAATSVGGFTTTPVST